MNKSGIPRAEPAQATSTVEGAAAELYASDPDQFTQRRKELSDRARAAGDREAARAITALRKPTRAAWVVNRLVRAVPDAPAQLADIASALRDAEQSRDGRRLRAESARRGALLDNLTDQAFAAAAIPDPPPGLREEVTGTLAAALADPEVAAQFASGTLTRATTWSGFGFAGAFPQADEAGEAEPSTQPSVQPPTDAPIAPVPLPTQAPRRLAPARSSGTPAEAPPSQEATTTTPARRPRRTQAEAPPGREAALAPPIPLRPASSRATTPPQPSIEDAERALTTASAVAAQATAAEERLEDHVRDLEQQLTRARADLADARRKARHAEAAERKARQALGRRQSDRR